MTRRDRVCVGAIAGAFGVRGEVRLKSFCAEPEAIAAYGPLETEDGSRSFAVTITRPVKAGFAARLAGIRTKEEGDALKGSRLYAPRDRLPTLEDNEFYHTDLIGLDVVDTGGAALGRVRTVQDYGAGDVLEVYAPGRGSLLLPFTQAVVPTVDLAAGRLVADPPVDGDEATEEGGIGHALIFGGTGMLADATRHIAGRASQVTLAARRPEALAGEVGATPVSLDWADRAATEARLNALPAPDLLLSWYHDDALWLGAQLEALITPGGRSIRVHGARSADPTVRAARDPSPRKDVLRQVVITGWKAGPPPRWLTNDEISRGTVEAVEDPTLTLHTIGTTDGPKPD